MTASTSHPGPSSEVADVRRAAIGEPVAGLAVLRKAVRGDDLQLLIARPDGSCWVTRFVDGRVGISCCISESDADEYFDVCLSSPSPRGAWTELEAGQELADDAAAA